MSDLKRVVENELKGLVKPKLECWIVRGSNGYIKNIYTPTFPRRLTMRTNQLYLIFYVGLYEDNFVVGLDENISGYKRVNEVDLKRGEFLNYNE